MLLSIKARALTFNLFVGLVLRSVVGWANSQLDIKHNFSFQGNAHKIKITLLLPYNLKKLTHEFEDLTRQALWANEERFQLTFKDDIIIFFDPRPNFHNGLTTVIPNNRIVVHLAPPVLGDSIGLYKDYLLETTAHELAHMITMQQRQGAFRTFSWFVGNTSRPNGTWPRWIHEGLAVWLESHMDSSKNTGRLYSGYIDLEKRKYADYFRRFKKDPLQNHQLDGMHPLYATHRATHPGAIPYHFGASLLQQWASDSNKTLGQFIHASSSSLGLSFRKTFASLGASIDESFEKTRTVWRQTALPNTAAPQPVLEHAHFNGPFLSTSTEGQFFANLIESSADDDDPYVSFRFAAHSNNTSPVYLTWSHPHLHPRQVAWSGQDFWLVLLQQHPDFGQKTFYDTGLYPRLRLAVVNSRSQIQCFIDIPDILREFSYHKGWLGWIVYDESFTFHAKQAQLDLANCQLKNPALLYQAQRPFERLSRLYSDGRRWMLSRALGRNALAEEIISHQGIISSNVPLSQPMPWPKTSDCQNCLLAHSFSPTHWGPVLIDLERKNIRRLEILTGSQRSVVLNDQIWVHEDLWEKDIIRAYPTSNLHPYLKNTAWTLRLEQISESSHSPQQPNNPNQYHLASAWDSVWPEFWIPLISLSSNSLLLGGETFFSDMRNNWSGSLQAGYFSISRSPFGNLQLNKRSLNGGPFEAASFYAYTEPRYYSFLGLTQNRWSTSLSFQSSLFVSSTLRAGISPHITLHQARPTSQLEGFQATITGFSAHLRSLYGMRENTYNHRLSKTRQGFVFDEKISFHKGWEADQRLNVHAPLLKGGLQWQLGYYATSEKNFPVLMGSWGGLYFINSAFPVYLNRGFPAQRGSFAKNILRSGLQWSWHMADINKFMSWNRAFAGSLDVTLLAESLSWNSFIESQYKLGRDFFSTVGAEVDLWAGVLHYVKIRSTLGVYRGFGDLGDLQMALVLRSNLDL